MFHMVFNNDQIVDISYSKQVRYEKQFGFLNEISNFKCSNVS